MSKHLEELSKNLAGGMSRRRAMWIFLATVGGSLVGNRSAMAKAGNKICVDVCRTQGLSGRDFGRCVSESLRCPKGSCALIVNDGVAICVPF